MQLNFFAMKIVIVCTVKELKQKSNKQTNERSHINKLCTK